LECAGKARFAGDDGALTRFRKPSPAQAILEHQPKRRGALLRAFTWFSLAGQWQTLNLSLHPHPINAFVANFIATFIEPPPETSNLSPCSTTGRLRWERWFAPARVS
jgi:hypothetical protein